MSLSYDTECGRQVTKEGQDIHLFIIGNSAKVIAKFEQQKATHHCFSSYPFFLLYVENSPEIIVMVSWT